MSPGILLLFQKLEQIARLVNSINELPMHHWQLLGDNCVTIASDHGRLGARGQRLTLSRKENATI